SPLELAGTAGRDASLLGRSLPEWKWSFSLSYAWQALTLDARWRYIGGMKDADAAIEAEVRIPHYSFFSLGVSYDWEEGMLAGLQLRVGAKNVTDEAPPIFPSYT